MPDACPVGAEWGSETALQTRADFCLDGASLLAGGLGHRPGTPPTTEKSCQSMAAGNDLCRPWSFRLSLLHAPASLTLSPVHLLTRTPPGEHFPNRSGGKSDLETGQTTPAFHG